MISLFIKGLKTYIYIDNLANVDEETENKCWIYDTIGNKIELLKFKRLKQRKYFDLCEDICGSRNIVDFLMCLKDNYFTYDDFNMFIKRFVEMNKNIEDEIMIDLNTLKRDEFLTKYNIHKIGEHYIIRMEG